jgi:hypothetical protein
MVPTRIHYPLCSLPFSQIIGKIPVIGDLGGMAVNTAPCILDPYPKRTERLSILGNLVEMREYISR